MLKTVVLYFYVILIFHELTDPKHLNSSVLTLASLFHVFRSCTSYLHHSLCMNANVNLSEWENLNSYRVIHTFSAWRLQVVSCEHAPAHWEDVSGIVAAVVIKSAPPAIEGNQNLHAPQRAHCGRTDEVWILPVHCLQLHPHLKTSFVLGQVALAVGPKRWRQNKWNISGRK